MRTRRGGGICVLLSVIGVGLCLYLGFLHIALLRGELFGGSVCGSTGGLLNCHAVTSGRWGSFAGLPLWVWGLIGYLAFLNLALLAWLFPDWATHALTLLTSLAVACVGIDLLLLTAMVTQVRLLCLFCLLTYLVNVLLLLTGKWALASPWSRIAGGFGAALRAFVPSTRRPLTWLFWGTLVTGAGGSVALHAATTYVGIGTPGMLKNQIAQFVGKEARTPPDISGDPSLGPLDAPVQVVEFSDFLCPACQKASKFNHVVLPNHRRDVRFVFKHFPLDTACNDAINRMVHSGACVIAAASECVQQQGKFWAFHDLVFERGHDYDQGRLRADVQQLGVNMEPFDRCVASGEGMEAVRKDITEGKRLNVGSTPTFFINGLRMPGIMAPAVFEELVGLLKAEKAS